ncbi:Wadjet anti-phage system protein JetA family protein [Mesorhizobium sp.]|uniref:Wadjet anti-phage system protein JetA family protein n=1 Tax=Mesorhizobium sp. TaxID=1871066 RepID=UPI0011FC5A8F|nr:Wadjet anti-phage system protein JetA family protein [Mesorhizobium sp.]TIL68470.1 MAG: hypothetical protein E5Y77_08880 [Mesorhizobium sp.]
MLFGQLNADIFTLFSGSNRHLYEHVLVKIYEDFFRSDLRFPTQSEVVSLIYERLGHSAELWREDETPVTFDQVVTGRGRRIRRRSLEIADTGASSEAMVRARHIYIRLLATGWLEETRYGLKVTVDMPPGAMRLAEFLCALREGMSEQLGGLVVQVRNELEALQVNARDNALGLHKAARDAASFGRYLRSVLSALREVDRQVLASDSIGRRLRHYFEDFVERVLLQDYAVITTTSHPYRFRHRIFAALDALEDSVLDIGVLTDAYLEARLAKDLPAARDIVFDDLSKIRRVFQRIEEAFERIQQHRARLETRLRNTVRYAGRRSGSFLMRSEPLLLQLDKLQESHGRTLGIPGPLEPRQSPLSPFLLARSRNARAPIVSGILLLPSAEPLRELRKRLEREHLDRLTVTSEQVSRFVERRVPPFGETEAANFWIDTIDDFLAFEALRLAVAASGDTPEDVHQLVAHLRESFSFQRSDGADVDNAWLACNGFRVQRKDDRVTLEGHDHAK